MGYFFFFIGVFFLIFGVLSVWHIKRTKFILDGIGTVLLTTVLSIGVTLLLVGIIAIFKL